MRLTTEEKTSLQRQGYSAFLIACLDNNLDEARNLWDTGGFFINAFSPENKTALMYACQVNNRGMVAFLLNNGADINLSFGEDDNDKWTALMEAGIYSDRDIIELLLERGANLCDEAQYFYVTREDSCIDENDRRHCAYAWQIPFYYNRVEIGAFLRDRVIAPPYDAYPSSILLMGCVELHCSESVDYLLKETGVVADFNDDEEIYIYTCLTKACNNGAIDLVKLLLSHNANPVRVDRDFFTPLMRASFEGHTDIVDLLLSLSTDEGLVIDANTAIQPVGEDADLTYAGYTALMLASQQGNINVLTRLLERGVDAGVKNEDGNTAFLLACQHGKHDCMNRLIFECNWRERNNDNDSGLMLACQNNHTETVRQLLGLGFDVNVSNKKGDNALMIACRNRNIEIVTMLLEEPGIDFAASNMKNETALLIAGRAFEEPIYATILAAQKKAEDRALAPYSGRKRALKLFDTEPAPDAKKPYNPSPDSDKSPR